MSNGNEGVLQAIASLKSEMHLRFESLDQRVQGLEVRIDAIDALELRIHLDLKEINAGFRKMRAADELLDARIDEMEARIERLEARPQ
jgi:hypothetical protein